MRLAAGLRPDPLGELKRSPRPPSRNEGGLLLREREGRGGKGKGGKGKGRGWGRAREERGGEGGWEGRDPQEKSWLRACVDKLLVQNNLTNSLFTQTNKQHGNRRTVIVLITHSSQLIETTSH